jgi:hypothetical protein
MRHKRPSSIALFGTVAMLLVPLGANAQAPTAAPTLAVTQVVGSEALDVHGTAPPNEKVEATLYARFSRELPTTLLSRRTIAANADGRYATTLPIAPGFFRNAVITVVVRLPSSNAVATANVLVVAPNAPAPPDDIPASVR